MKKLKDRRVKKPGLREINLWIDKWCEKEEALSAGGFNSGRNVDSREYIAFYNVKAITGGGKRLYLNKIYACTKGSGPTCQ